MLKLVGASSCFLGQKVKVKGSKGVVGLGRWVRLRGSWHRGVAKPQPRRPAAVPHTPRARGVVMVGCDVVVV